MGGRRTIDQEERVMTGTRTWMRANLTTQGYCLSDAARRQLALGLRFSTGLCLTLVVVALALESAALVFALSGIGVIAGFSGRHPFDHLWNHGVRQRLGGLALPPNPTRRRHAFKLATVWLLAVGTLLAAGATTVALLLGGVLVAACATVTATNLCLPSEALAWWERRHAPPPKSIKAGGPRPPRPGSMEPAVGKRELETRVEEGGSNQLVSKRGRGR
jgi:uncharacterized protein DUF4395